MKEFTAAPDERIRKYIEREFAPEDEILKKVRELAKAGGLPEIQVGSMDGLHLEAICRATGARRAVEIGTLGGYSGIRIARALGSQGKLFTLELEETHARVARKAFELAGVSNQVEILLGAAIDSLPKLGAQGPFDLVFIDADKTGYPAYFEWAAKNLRVGGVILADNTLAWGMIADERFENPEDREAVLALRAFNHALSHDPRFCATLLPTGEGLTMGVKIRE